MKKYIVKLTNEERDDLERILSTGSEKARKILYARILLKADESEHGPSWKDEQISEALETSLSTILRVRERFVEEGLEAALHRRPGSGIREVKVDGECEAHLIALTCSTPPEGYGRWTLRLLAETMVELEYIDAISYETVRKVLKKNELKPWQKKQWCIPPEANAEFVCHMEDVLEVYKRPYNPAYPVICMDEASKQLIKETRIPLPMRPGNGECYDFEYERAGTRNLFMVCEPLAGKRYVKVTEHRTKQDWAFLIRELVDVWYPDAKKVILVMDNLNTHVPYALYEAFDPEEARRVIDQLEIHYTPKHGSWLNMAEIELSVLSGQSLDRRIGSEKDLIREVAAWQEKRNKKEMQVNWHFTTQDARIKLKHLYPSLSQ
jgi:transposase